MFPRCSGIRRTRGSGLQLEDLRMSHVPYTHRLVSAVRLEWRCGRNLIQNEAIQGIVKLSLTRQ